MKLKYFFVPFFLFLTLVIRSQEFPAYNITIEDGLPSNTIYSLYQDTKGFVWIGTQSGLVRYNGVSFKKYNGDQLKSTAISRIQEDAFGTIWMINFYGQILYVEGDKLIPLKSWEELNLKGFPRVIVNNEVLYISNRSNNTVYQYSITAKKIMSSYQYSKTLSEVAFESFSEKEIWTHSYYNNFKRLYPNQDSVSFSTKIPIDNGDFPRLSKLGSKHYLLGVKQDRLFEIDSSYRLNDLSTPLKSILKPKREIKSIGDNYLALIGLNGLHLMDSLHRITPVLEKENVSAILQLNSNVLLLGTLDKGLFLVPTLNSKVFRPALEKAYLKIIHHKKQKRLIVGDQSGAVHFYDYKGNLEKSIASDGVTEIQSMYLDTISNILYYQNNNLQYFDFAKNKLKQLSGGQTTKGFYRKDSLLYMPSSEGLRVKNQNHFYKEPVMKDVRMSLVEPIDNTHILIGSQKGPLVYNTTNNRFVENKFVFQSKIKDLISAKFHNEKLYLGTSENGLYIYENNQLLEHFTVDKGLTSNKILSIDINAKWIALGTNEGVTLIEKSTRNIIKITRSKGLKSIEIPDLVLTDKKLWVVHRAGLQLFNLPLDVNHQKPKIIVNQIKYDSLLVSKKSKTIHLPYNFSKLSIDLDISNDIVSQGKSTVFYRIKEINKEQWSTTTLSNSMVEYVSLPSGNYTFEAYSATNDGVKSALLSLPITVATPYWQQWWFILCTYLTVILFVVGLSYYFLGSINKRKQQELVLKNRAQELRIAQLASIRAQLNPHFIFNTMSLIKTMVNKGAPIEASTTIQDFSHLMRGVLEHSSTELISVADEVKIIENYLAIEAKRFDDEMIYTVEVNEAIDSDFIKIPSLITQPFVENAIKHGLLHKEGLKELSVRFSLKNKTYLTIEIEDNGVGRAYTLALKKEKNHHSFALKAYKKRIDLMNQNNTKKINFSIKDLMSATNLPKGTLVTIEIPLEY